MYVDEREAQTGGFRYSSESNRKLGGAGKRKEKLAGRSANFQFVLEISRETSLSQQRR